MPRSTQAVSDTSQKKWRYQFRKPDVQEILWIKEVIAAMPVYVPKRERHFLGKDNMTVEGSLEAVIGILADFLADDYASNIVERENAPWDFDYVVTDDGVSSGAIEVLTRLFNPLDPAMGSSLYGRTIRRMSDTTYRLWAET